MMHLTLDIELDHPKHAKAYAKAITEWLRREIPEMLNFEASYLHYTTTDVEAVEDHMLSRYKRRWKLSIKDGIEKPTTPTSGST